MKLSSFDYYLVLVDFSCSECEKSFIDDGGLWPDNATFNTYLADFLSDNPCEACAKGGHAAYGQVRNHFLT